MDTKPILYGLIILSISIFMSTWLYITTKDDHPCKYDVITSSGLILLNKETGELKAMKYDPQNGKFQDAYLTSPEWLAVTTPLSKTQP